MWDTSLESWLQLWRGIQQISTGGHQRYEQLVALYSEPHRAYHNLAHIAHCLRELNECEYPYAEELAFAIWYHDAIYDPRAHDNEKRSLELANEVMSWGSFLRRTGGMVSHMIMSTKHDGEPVDDGCKTMADIDLAILGQPPSEFDIYERQIREEYSWVDDEDFRTGRLKLLTSFANRQSVYFTEHFQKKYEAQARSNLEHSIARLQGGDH